jgi:hypothetical protein
MKTKPAARQTTTRVAAPRTAMLRELFARCLSSHPSSVDDADDACAADARRPSTSMSTLTRTDSAKRSTSTSSTPTTLTPSSSLGRQTRKTPTSSSSLSRVGSAKEGSGAAKTVVWAKDVETTVVVVKREEEEAFGGRRRERSLPSTTTTGGGRSSGNSTMMILSKDIFYNDAFRESLERRSRRT